MATLKHTLAIPLLALLPLHAQDLDKAEVRIPYSELKQLLDRSQPAAPPPAPAPDPALLSATLRLSIESDRPVIDATFRIAGFGKKLSTVPLIGGGISLLSQQPDDALILIEDDRLCLATDHTGSRSIQLRLLPIVSPDGISITLPPCPSSIFETGDFPAGHSLTVHSGGSAHTFSSGQMLPLPPTGGTLTMRILDSRETLEALRPPEPSTWSWQNRALVIPSGGELTYQIFTSASAAGGSGVEALLPMPPEARDITVEGEDLVSHTNVRGENRALSLALTWKTRDILDRRLAISYRMPLRPLDPTWQLRAPGGDGTLTRFIIADSPLLSYSAEGLTGPMTSAGLPSYLSKHLDGGTCHHLEGTDTAALTVTPVPVAATAEGVVTSAEWTLRIEPDGAMLATGIMHIEHKGPLDFTFDTPPGMKLLTCELSRATVSPVDLGNGGLMVNLPPHEEKSQLVLSFTGNTAALDPVEGTMELALPKTPLFIHALTWNLDLPPGYQAETHGNLKRIQSISSAPPSRIALRKNLCRDERPEARIFYQRSDLNR